MTCGVALTRSAGSSLPVAGPGGFAAADPARPGGRILGPGPDRRHGGRRPAHPRCAQRSHGAALADPAHAGGHVDHPSSWWISTCLTTEPLEFASLTHSGGTPWQISVDRMFDPSASLAELAWLREQWPGRIVVKGIQDPEDAQVVAEPRHRRHRRDPTHGGAAASPGSHPARGAAGDPSTRSQGGPRVPARHRDHGRRLDIRPRPWPRGRGCLVGRARTLYGLMAGGEHGVDRALSILRDQVTRTMRLLRRDLIRPGWTPAHAIIRRRDPQADVATP